MFDYIKSKLGKNFVIAGAYNRSKHATISERQFRLVLNHFFTVFLLKIQRYLLQSYDMYSVLQYRTIETNYVDVSGSVRSDLMFYPEWIKYQNIHEIWY